VGLFGSVARGDDTGESDVDLVVELDRQKSIGLIAFTGTIVRIEEFLERKVDVVTIPVKKPSLRTEIERDRIDAF